MCDFALQYIVDPAKCLIQRTVMVKQWAREMVVAVTFWMDCRGGQVHKMLRI